MEKNNPCEQQIRIEHQWTEEHVRAYLKDQYNYTIHLHTGSIIREATFHYCHLFKKHYFAVGTSVILIEDVYSHSMKGHPAPPEPEPAPAYQTRIITFNETIGELDLLFRDHIHWGVATLKAWIDGYENTRFTPIDEKRAVITSVDNMNHVMEWLEKNTAIEKCISF